MSKLRVAVVGCGSISHCHFPVYKKLADEVELVACADIDFERDVTASVADYLMLNKTKPEGIELKTIEEVVAECL